MKSKFYALIAVVVLLSMALAACQPAAPAPEAPAAQAPAAEAPAAEAPAAEAPAAEFEPLVLTAPDCDYGGMIKELAALDEYTVQISLCVPDPAFASKAAFTAFSILSEAEVNGG